MVELNAAELVLNVLNKTRTFVPRSELVSGCLLYSLREYHICGLTYQGHSQDLTGGGKNFFFRIWEFACRMSHEIGLLEINILFLINVQICVLIYMAITMKLFY